MFAVNILSKPMSLFRKGPQVFLAFIWVLALAGGALFTVSNMDILLSLLQALPLCRVSVIGLTVASLIPLILTGLTIKLQILPLFYTVVFLEGFSGGVFLTVAAVLFGSSGWLIYVLFAFARWVPAVPRLYLYLHCVLAQQKCCYGFIHCLLATMIAVLFEYIFISPLIASLVF